MLIEHFCTIKQFYIRYITCSCICQSQSFLASPVTVAGGSHRNAVYDMLTKVLKKKWYRQQKIGEGDCEDEIQKYVNYQ
jgi:hypothetical protein